MLLSQTVLVQNIQTLANAVGTIDSRGVPFGVMEKEQAEALLAQCGACLAAFAAALDTGTAASDTIAVTLCSQSEVREWTLDEWQAWCREVQTHAAERIYRSRIQQALLQANVWVSDLGEPESLSDEQATFAAEAGSILLQVLEDAQAAGVSENMVVELNEAPVSLAQVRKLGLYVAAAGKDGDKE